MGRRKKPFSLYLRRVQLPGKRKPVRIYYYRTYDEHGARTVQENGAPGLNLALARATIVAQNYTTRGILIVPADLPLVTRQDLRKLVALGTRPPVVVVAPDRRGEGTNALLVSPVGLIEYAFGTNSYQRHLKEAAASGARLEVCDLVRLSLDVDLPEDLALVREAKSSRPT